MELLNDYKEKNLIKPLKSIPFSLKRVETV